MTGLAVSVLSARDLTLFQLLANRRGSQYKIRWATKDKHTCQ